MNRGQIYYLPDSFIEEMVRRAKKEYRDYKYLGAHFMDYGGELGVSFMVMAPKAAAVKVVGDFNGWDGCKHPMKPFGNTGLWHIFIIGLSQMALYKYQIVNQEGHAFLKADPFAFYSELRPDTASRCVDVDGYGWQDALWFHKKSVEQENCINIYEVHLGSWRRKENGEFCNYKEIGEELLDYVDSMGYTHIELLPLMEHPFDGSWGYQVTGFFSVTSRYGNPWDFMYFVDLCHQRGIGVILDWVPGHFCRDQHGLRLFDGTPLYEFNNPSMADNVEWGTSYFDHSKEAVSRFLISNAMFWLDVFHIDGLRVDAVSYMLYLDAGRARGSWQPNKNGGRENLKAVSFLRRLNRTISRYFPNALIIAEEATAWPGVTSSVKNGGLGFHYKWNMGWMNDLLSYMQMDPIYRKWHHNLLCFSFVYAFTERFILVLSHDEVVHGKKSLLNKMPGDYDSKFANLRTFYGYMIGHPGKKLIFMGGEFGQFIEWDYNKALDWMLLDYEHHRQLQDFVKALNWFYREEPALYQLDHKPDGFQWIDSSNSDESIIAFMRKAIEPNDFIIVVCNFTPVVRSNYRIGVPKQGIYQEIFNTDSKKYGGSGVENLNKIEAEAQQYNDRPYSILLIVPPLSTIFLKPITKL